MLDLITLPYARPRWSGLLRQLFAQYDEHAVPLAIPVPEGGLAEAIHQLGVVTLPRDAGGENLALAVIEITASDAVALLRNRVGIRNLAARLLSPGTADGLLVATTQPGNPAWRFTFVHRETRFDDAGTLVRQETPTRRFTYVLGPGESCRTPDTRFQFLARHRGATALAHVLDAFSVEKLSQEFFTQYHFTIDENDPEDHEIGIDPEMLGRIFENLLEDNKEKGAFYTPKPVVQEMCQRSLIQSLASRYPGDPEALAAIENLIRLKAGIRGLIN